MKKLLVALLPLACFAQYTDGTVLEGDIGSTTITITDSGPLAGGTQTVTLPVGANQRFKIWLSIAGYPEQGSTAVCHAPCTISMNTEYGQVSYWYSITDSSGNPLSPPLNSSRLYLSFVAAPTQTAPFTVPEPIHGFSNYTTYHQFSASGFSISSLRVWVRSFNVRQGDASILMNGNEHQIVSTDLNGLTSNGSTCTATTVAPHGLVNGVAYVNNITSTSFPSLGYPSAAQGAQTITVAGSSSFTFPCSLSSGNWGIPIGGLCSGAGCDFGWNVSQQFSYGDEYGQYFGGLNGPDDETYDLLVPLSSAEMNSGTNTLGLRFKGIGDASLHDLAHGWYALNWNIIEPDVSLTQISVSGLAATATCSASCGYSNGQTVIIRNAPGPYWRFNGPRVVTATTTNTFSFSWGPSNGAGSSPYLTANGTYAVPTSSNTSVAPQPVMYAALALIPASSFTPLTTGSFPGYGGNATNGGTWFQTATLKEPNGYFPGHASKGHCSSCHAANGADLKYFAFHPYVIKIACLHRGLTESQANDIVAYISGNAMSYTGWPWNPPYQPGTGLDSGSLSAWSAGAGNSWWLTYDADKKEYLAPGGSYAVFSMTGSVNTREVPTFTHLPAWNKWLPAMSPDDYYFYFQNGATFTSTAGYTDYHGFLTGTTSSNFSSYQTQGFFQQLEVDFQTFRQDICGANVSIAGNTWPSQVKDACYSVVRWYMVRQWELLNVLNMQGFWDQATNAVYGTPNARAGSQATRGSLFHVSFSIGPHISLGNSQFLYKNVTASGSQNFNNETAEWYYLSLILGFGNRMFTGNVTTDVPYTYAFMQNQSESRPSFWDMALLTSLEPQQTWGQSTLSGSNSMALHAFRWNLPLLWRWTDLLTSESDKGALIEAEAEQMYSATSTFTSGQWLTYFTALDGCTAHTPNAPAALNGSGCYADSLAMGIAYMHYFGVDSTTLNGMVAFANAVYGNAVGYDYTTNATSTCTYTNPGGNPPRVLSCP